MKTIGIIAEYNPFHNGHAYQIQKIRELTGADYIVIAMSGDFVQRGAPAIMDKYARTRMALSCGADLVIELPVLWATASAESFAMAGVTLFDKMGCVDGLCFGAESDNLPLLSRIADILAEEPESYRNALASYLKCGLNFPSARAKALVDCCTLNDMEESGFSEILNSPNNILAIEYLKALRRRNSKITPVLVKREGAGYHETQISGSGIRASATAIRETLLAAEYHNTKTNRDSQFVKMSNALEGQLTVHALPNETFSSLEHAVPTAALNILSEYCSASPLLTQDDFSTLLSYRILLESSQGLSHFCDSNMDISNRILKNRNQFLSFSQFCELNKSRDITYTRMSRILLHILLGLTNEDSLFGKKLDYIPYLRLLGFCKASSPLLSDSKRCASVPMISKLSDAGDLLGEDAMQLLRQDIFAAELYEQILSHKKGTIPRSEYTREIVRL